MGPAVLEANGAFAAIFGTGAQRRVVAFDRYGTAVTIGKTAAASLRTDSNRSVVYGSGKRFSLTDLPIPCAKLRGQNLSLTPGMRVVKDVWSLDSPSESVAVSQLRGCVAGGVVRSLGLAQSGPASTYGNVRLSASAGRFVITSVFGGGEEFSGVVVVLTDLQTDAKTSSSTTTTASAIRPGHTSSRTNGC